ncbi:TetR/AcrR family transcriptional regulator [Jannaschia sp. R86511]|uniref:TetR/AcrR family transcriptional regulator n=1 Tax=Jannaschia sp. R86511 TaxID=3093853 RepID=UPI0036D3CDB4
MTSSLRRDQVQMTHQRILAAMASLLQEKGYTATTITAVAERAGVAVPTVYRTFGTKSAIVKRLYDVTLAGDDADLPMVERPEYQALLAADTLDDTLARYADLAAGISARLGPLMTPLLGAAHAGDPDVRDFVATIDRERLTGMQIFSRKLERFGVEPGNATDILWVLTSPDLHHRLVHERGWSDTRFRAWLGRTLAQQLNPHVVAADDM